MLDVCNKVDKMNSYETTLDAHMTITGKTAEELLKNIHELCDVSTEYTLEGRSVLGKVVRVIDGDSVKVSIPVDGHVWTFPVRIDGIDCPEVRTRNKTEKELGIEAKNHVEKLVLGKIVSLKLGEFDKFGRLLGTLTTSDGVRVSDDLISAGLAVPYKGGKRPVWFLKGAHSDALASFRQSLINGT